MMEPRARSIGTNVPQDDALKFSRLARWMEVIQALLPRPTPSASATRLM